MPISHWELNHKPMTRLCSWPPSSQNRNDSQAASPSHLPQPQFCHSPTGTTLSSKGLGKQMGSTHTTSHAAPAGLGREAQDESPTHQAHRQRGSLTCQAGAGSHEACGSSATGPGR